MDDSKAFLLALVRAFTNCGILKKYILDSVASLQFGTPPPPIYIRLDRSHLFRNAVKKITDNDARKSDFYLSVFGYLVQCLDFAIAKNVIADFFTVLLNKFDGEYNFRPSPVQLCKQRLFELCSSHKYNVIDGLDDGLDDHIDDDTNEERSIFDDSNESAQSEWLSDILQGIEIINEKDPQYHDNLYYNPDRVDVFTKMFSTITLWSNVLNEKFGSPYETATSSDVESNMKLLKNNILEKQMWGVDKFMNKHVEYLLSTIKQHMVAGKIDEKFSHKSSLTGIIYLTIFESIFRFPLKCCIMIVFRFQSEQLRYIRNLWQQWKFFCNK